jgi:hypothetical protein
MRRSSRLPWLLAVLTLPALSACDILTMTGAGGAAPIFETPSVRVSAALLTDYPGVDELAGWYCPSLAESAFFCETVLNLPQVEHADLQFQFQVDIDVTNPNTYAIPTAEALVALTLYPAETDEALAGVCIGFCDEGAESCSTDPLEGQCQSDEPEILSVEDLAQAALGYLQHVITSATLGQVPEELKLKMIPAGETRTLNITLAIGIDPMLDLLEAVFRANWTQYVDASGLELIIPYQVDGTLWFVVENLGKYPIRFGPYGGEWRL